MKKIFFLIFITIFSYGDIIKYEKIDQSKSIVQVPSVKVGATSTIQNETSKATYDKAVYEEALNNYKQKNYEKAYQLFDKIFFEDMGNKLLNYYLGRSAFETKRYEFAVSAYDRILIGDPDNVKVRLELARTYLNMQLYSQAFSEFNTALLGKMPIKVRKKVLANIELIKNKHKKHFFSLTTLLGLSYDTNINSTTDVGGYTIYVPEFGSNLEFTNDAEQEGAFTLQAAAILNHQYKPEDNFILESNASVLITRNKNHSSNDATILSASTKPTIFANKLKIENALSIDRIYYGGEAFQLNYFVAPSLTQILNAQSLFKIGLKIGQINYDNFPTRDASQIELQNNLKYLTKDHGTFSFNINLGQEREQEEVRTDVSYDYFDFLISNSYDFGEHYALTSSVGYQIDKYTDRDFNFLNKRKDIKTEYSLGLQRKLSNTSVLNIGASLIDNYSNQVINDYDKSIYKINYIKTF